MDLKEKVRSLPSSPGVYLMKDSLNSIIYVGKSKNLKSRVGSYFQNSKAHSPKVVKMVKNIRNFDYILTDTEFEAFMLECKLIRQIKPICNKKMKSPLSYAYVRIKSDYSDIEICNEKEEDIDSIYFGPYTNKNTVERGIQGIKECCKINCSGNFGKSSPCLNYFLGSCIGMCFDDAARNKYNVIMSKIIELLSGTGKSILKEMELNMKEAAEKLDFDTAARYRDYIAAVDYLVNKEKVVEFTEENKNIALLEYINKDTIKFFIISGIKILYKEKYKLSELNGKNLKIHLRDNILRTLEHRQLINSIDVGKYEIDESQIIYSYLKNKQNNCKYFIIADSWIADENILSIDEAVNTIIEKEE